MEKLAFEPIIDVPLAVTTLAMFLWHFDRWAVHHDLETSIDTVSRLPVARLRVITIFACALGFCWLANFAFWSIFALLLVCGVAIALLVGDNLDAGAFGFCAVAYLIREWAFGFPQLILHPQTRHTRPGESRSLCDGLVGKTGLTTSPLRPAGDVEIEGITYSVVSDTGQLIESGTHVTVTSHRNGIACVSPITSNEIRRDDCPPDTRVENSNDHPASSD